MKLELVQLQPKLEEAKIENAHMMQVEYIECFFLTDVRRQLKYVKLALKISLNTLLSVPISYLDNLFWPPTPFL